MYTEYTVIACMQSPKSGKNVSKTCFCVVCVEAAAKAQMKLQLQQITGQCQISSTHHQNTTIYCRPVILNIR